MTKNTEKDFKKIHSMDKSSIIEHIRGISKPIFINSGYWNVGVYVFNCAVPWIEKGDIDVIKEVIRKDFSVIRWADELHEIVFSRDLIIFSLQEIYRQQFKYGIRELEDISNQKLDHTLIEEAFPEKDLLEKFIEFGINKFSRDFIRSFPWQDYPNLLVTCFSKIPLKLRKQNKAFCLSFICGKEEFSINDFEKIPKEFKSDQLFMKLIFNKFAYQKMKRSYDRVSRLERFYKTTQDNLFWKDEFNLCSYLAFGAEEEDIYIDLKELDPAILKSNQVKKLLIKNYQVKNFHEIFNYIGKAFTRSISFRERFYLYNRYKIQSKNTSNPFISALFEKNIFHWSMYPGYVDDEKINQRRYLKFLDKFNEN
tara:strand:- start:48 stop:1148 length:1101 start_codon:yes stop_codon:yes gene_type:complete